MNKQRILTLIFGILNIVAGIILVTFIILMQNPLAFIMGVLYIVFGGAMLNSKIYKKLLFWGIVPITILFSSNMIMLGICKNVPKYFHIPLHIGLLIILPLWLIIYGNIYSCKRR